ncbi:MAG: dihydrolipoamide dehydrogenase [Zetaproteobacteria bacterium CG12_big_fil_rev_8_21_14_0_65_55_1124]|nr:MAG: dihydrolipoamide dehydrogenase [Zetaproteobacteria bacterium CG1_02_55_237]PIS19114.1 MAG: dihydrolipoamide dehydrogenase [Zetaproteobacteria bacterium CG08_land_8_20_14_0_20_55_17]PIW43707.1 MAG: dihydrolipoamide dehydrogenase [Zetaproteobacteria bacterium CG12_big_fil_rev_8_21_14_0_65_55_1124]PIY53126.1 MAG: dihydrolipoamide dehydrogenase [Zetaproteobacteria bacterium CG_4_10_14_0_8_um_filter_55_43]PIZ38567.1 MAG: dihydrolipoamide dehydrogenase [Zetaproteobacteria bacterium CG_4_10_14
MSAFVETDICVIGAGSGGLSLAAGAAQMGTRVVLVEKGEMGGDCLNTGCVPSKALLAAGEKAQAVRDASHFGLETAEPATDWEAVNRHVHGVIAAIAPNDSVERFEGLGVKVIRAAGAFVDSKTLKAGDTLIRAKFFVVATGSSPFVPPIEGLAQVDYFTNENIFANQQPIEHLIVIGGGPIGLEMAQAHRRLGAKVTVMEMARLLPKDDPELTKVVIDRLAEEGIAFYEGSRNLRFEKTKQGLAAYCTSDAGEQCVHGTHLLISTGRRANVRGLNLEAAGVDYTPHGITVDARLRSTNKRIFAIGDVAGPYQFTHMAAYQAGIVIRNVLFRLPARVDYSAVPWVTYTDPELAHVGMSEADAEKAGKEIRVLRWGFAENDRAQAERRTEGLVKVVTDMKGRILGASIVGLHAGELLQPWVLAISQKMKIGAMAGMISPYPTLGEVNKRIAGSYYTPSLFSDKVRRIVRFLLRF